MVEPARWSAGRPPVGLPQEGVQMLWANAAAWQATRKHIIAQQHRALSVDGYLMFSCLGPDTAKELHAVYAARSAGRRPGMRSPTCTTGATCWCMPRFTRARDGHGAHPADLCHATAAAAGAGRAGVQSAPSAVPCVAWTLLSRRLYEVLRDKLGSLTRGGQLALTFEIIYGHAYKPKPRVRVSASSAVSLEDMRAMLREGSSKG